MGMLFSRDRGDYLNGEVCSPCAATSGTTRPRAGKLPPTMAKLSQGETSLAPKKPRLKPSIM